MPKKVSEYIYYQGPADGFAEPITIDGLRHFLDEFHKQGHGSAEVRMADGIPLLMVSLDKRPHRDNGVLYLSDVHPNGEDGKTEFDFEEGIVEVNGVEIPLKSPWQVNGNTVLNENGTPVYID